MPGGTYLPYDPPNPPHKALSEAEREKFLQQGMEYLFNGGPVPDARREFAKRRVDEKKKRSFWGWFGKLFG